MMPYMVTVLVPAYRMPELEALFLLQGWVVNRYEGANIWRNSSIGRVKCITETGVLIHGPNNDVREWCSMLDIPYEIQNMNIEDAVNNR